MSFYEDLAAALDDIGFESRVNDDVLFVPITSDVELQFVEIDPILPAANVYVAAPGECDEESEFEAALVGVVFSVEDAVKTVIDQVNTDQVVTLLRDLLDGTDERIADLVFEQDAEVPSVVTADVTDTSTVVVAIEVIDEEPTATVSFVSVGDHFGALMQRAREELDAIGDGIEEEDRPLLLQELAMRVGEATEERLHLGSFQDFDRLFDVLALAAEKAEDWEEQLVPLEDEVDLFEVLGREWLEDLDFDDEDDDDEDDDDDCGEGDAAFDGEGDEPADDAASRPDS